MWNVLIADDEPKIRQGLKNTLETFDLPLCVCAEAKNGLEALEKANEYEPDSLLVDICMPKLSGIKFLEELKKPVSYTHLDVYKRQPIMGEAARKRPTIPARMRFSRCV